MKKKIALLVLMIGLVGLPMIGQAKTNMVDKYLKSYQTTKNATKGSEKKKSGLDSEKEDANLFQLNPISKDDFKKKSEEEGYLSHPLISLPEVGDKVVLATSDSLITIIDQNWLNITDNVVMNVGDEFEENKFYEYQVFYKIDKNEKRYVGIIEWDEDYPFYFGYGMGLATNPGEMVRDGMMIYTGELTDEVFENFNPVSANLPILEIELSKNPTKAPKSDLYTIVEEKWYNRTDNKEMKDTDVFEENKKYDYVAITKSRYYIESYGTIEFPDSKKNYLGGQVEYEEEPFTYRTTESFYFGNSEDLKISTGAIKIKKSALPEVGKTLSLPTIEFGDHMDPNNYYMSWSLEKENSSEVIEEGYKLKAGDKISFYLSAKAEIGYQFDSEFEVIDENKNNNYIRNYFFTSSGGYVSYHAEFQILEEGANIGISEEDLSILYPNRSKGLSVFPESEANSEITWTSSDETVATIDEFGWVKAHKIGKTTITATNKNGEKATYELKVETPVESIQTEKEMTLYVGEEKNINIEVTPTNAVERTFYFQNNNYEVASVYYNDNGSTIVGHQVGDATITITSSSNENAKSSILVHVIKRPDATKVTKNSLTLKENEAETLEALIEPKDADQHIVWISEDVSIAKVNRKGKVTGVKEGEATIIAKAESGIQATCKVTVTKGDYTETTKYKVTFYDEDKETILKEGTYEEGTAASKIELPQNLEKDGYVLSWYSDKEYTNQYNFSGTLTSDLTLYAKWEEEKLSLETTTELLDYGETTINFKDSIQKKVIIKNTGNVDLKLSIKNPTDKGPFGSMGFDIGHLLKPGKEYELTLIANSSGTYHDTPGTYNGNYIITGTSNEKSTTLEIPAKIVLVKEPQKISYQTHVQTYGWQDYVSNGKMSGTEGEAKRLEGIKIKLENQEFEGNVLYRTHIQSFGWEKEFKKNDEMSGTSGLAKRLEAIEIKLDGEISEHYDVYYRVHAQTFGWLGWARNGEPSGTAAYAKRLEGIEIMLVEKGQVVEDYGKKDAFLDKNAITKVSLNKEKLSLEEKEEFTLVATIDPVEAVDKTITWSSDNEEVATVDESGKVTGVKTGIAKITATTSNGKTATCEVNVIPAIAGVEYKTHVQTYGWQDYVRNGEMSGTSGEAKRLEGINIKLRNAPYEGNILYRTHIQSFGWEETFKKNDEMSGTSGLAKRLEAIEIKLDGEMAEHYDIYYRVHAQTFGWLDWARNGEPSGTAGYAKRLEGIEIVLVEKGGEPPIRENISTDESFIEKEEELTGLNKVANNTLMKLFLGGPKECSLIEAYLKDKIVTSNDIDNLTAYSVAQINEFPTRETITLEEMKNAVKKYFGKDYLFDVDSLNLNGTCSSHIYDKEKQAFVQREGGCGSACFRSTSYKIINTTEKDGLLNIQVKVIFADESTEKYYSDYERTKEIGTFRSSLSSLYEKGSNYQFTFKLEDNNYVFVSSTPLN